MVGGGGRRGGVEAEICGEELSDCAEERSAIRLIILSMTFLGVFVWAEKKVLATRGDGRKEC